MYMLICDIPRVYHTFQVKAGEPMARVWRPVVARLHHTSCWASRRRSGKLVLRQAVGNSTRAKEVKEYHFSQPIQSSFQGIYAKTKISYPALTPVSLGFPSLSAIVPSFRSALLATSNSTRPVLVRNTTVRRPSTTTGDNRPRHLLRHGLVVTGRSVVRRRHALSGCQLRRVKRIVRRVKGCSLLGARTRRYRWRTDRLLLRLWGSAARGCRR